MPSLGSDGYKSAINRFLEFAGEPSGTTYPRGSGPRDQPGERRAAGVPIHVFRCVLQDRRIPRWPGDHQAKDEQHAASHSSRGVNRDRLRGNGSLRIGNFVLGVSEARSWLMATPQGAVVKRGQPTSTSARARSTGCAPCCPSKARRGHATVVDKATVSWAGGIETPARRRHSAPQNGLAARPWPDAAVRSSRGPPGMLPLHS
jgi:hypothetical protein